MSACKGTREACLIMVAHRGQRFEGVPNILRLFAAGVVSIDIAEVPGGQGGDMGHVDIPSVEISLIDRLLPQVLCDLTGHAVVRRGKSSPDRLERPVFAFFFTRQLNFPPPPLIALIEGSGEVVFRCFFCFLAILTLLVTKTSVNFPAAKLQLKLQWLFRPVKRAQKKPRKLFTYKGLIASRPKGLEPSTFGSTVRNRVL